MPETPHPSPEIEDRYQKLVSLAEQLGIGVRLDNIDAGHGGLYILKNKKHLLLNRNDTLGDRVDTLVDILKNEDLSEIFVLPALREALECR